LSDSQPYVEGFAGASEALTGLTDGRILVQDRSGISKLSGGRALYDEDPASTEKVRPQDFWVQSTGRKTLYQRRVLFWKGTTLRCGWVLDVSQNQRLNLDEGRL
jgi:hypothetical protein